MIISTRSCVISVHFSFVQLNYSVWMLVRMSSAKKIGENRSIRCMFICGAVFPINLPEGFTATIEQERSWPQSESSTLWHNWRALPIAFNLSNWIQSRSARQHKIAYSQTEPQDTISNKHYVMRFVTRSVIRHPLCVPPLLGLFQSIRQCGEKSRGGTLYLRFY